MKPIKALTLFSIGFALTGCFESNKNTEQLCSNNPGLQCERLNMGDGQCRIPRTDLIWHRYELQKNPTDENQIKEYGYLAEYKKCLELAAQIQPIDQSNLKERRFSALVNAGEDLESIISTLEQANSPESFYFLWSQTGSAQAQRKFLQLEGSPVLETAEMQYALATFYTSRDQQKTRHLLLHALELTGRNTVNTEIFKSLASTTYRMGLKKEAYIWTEVAKSYEVPVASQSELQLLYGFDQSTYDQLDDIAEEIESAIKSGNFASSMIPTFRNK